MGSIHPMGIDITDQMKQETSPESARIELARVARIAAVGELTASIAHEISQPLASILANGCASQRWLAMEPPDLSEAREALAETIREANRACELVARIRDLLSKKPLQSLLLDVNQIILQMLTLTAAELRAGGVTVQTALEADLPAVFGDSVQLQQVMLNLLTNGIDAMSAIVDRPKKLSIRSVKDPLGVLIQVRDSGIGFKPSLAETLFAPFFTTKPQGLGLGLSISRSIIEAHGGSLWATVDDSYGAAFEFTLPKG
jgi:C4-dicarboxylate-specific signal transduction histidine kinase